MHTFKYLSPHNNTMALQNEYSTANANADPALIAAAQALQEGKAPATVDPKQVLIGVASACGVMLSVLLMCVLIAYLSLAALHAF